MTRLLSHAQAARFYDLLGTGQDTQSFYETAAVHDLITHLELATCHSVFEFGFGTGRLAVDLLREHLPADATYFGLDVSATMTRLAKSRLQPFAARADVKQSDGTPRIDAENDTFDRFISTYVFDLLSDDDIRAILTEARRVVKPGGLLGLVSLTDGPGPLSRVVSTTWCGLHRISPWLVGGCRPISFQRHLSGTEWRIEHRKVVVRFGISSEVVVARAM
jgi:ubiquinone/menaquinone biosynthesis C-methylase UbiE